MGERWQDRVQVAAAPYDLPEPCRLWTGSAHERGYGRVRQGSRVMTVHRLAWAEANGREVPDEMLVLHRCDRPACIEPSHLYLGTHADNAAAKVRRGRGIGRGYPRTAAAC